MSQYTLILRVDVCSLTCSCILNEAGIPVPGSVIGVVGFCFVFLLISEGISF